MNKLAMVPQFRARDYIYRSNASGGHPFLLSRGIRGHPFPKMWELRGIRFHNMGIRFSKTPFWEGIKRIQLHLLKLKKATEENTHISQPTILLHRSMGSLISFRILQRLLSGLVGGPWAG